jgi:4-amino-4-deoxy-L-arabinose transferase-like glycosyltransferase
MNADELSFGYNAYSLVKTGKDEYGATLPMRLKSFGDYKLPLYSYIATAPIALIGLNETAVRFPAFVAGVLLPFIVYLLVKKLFEDDNKALMAGFLVAVSPLFGEMTRHAHEGTIMIVFLLAAIYFLIKVMEEVSYRNISLFSLFMLLSLFSYHIARVFAVFLVGYLLIHLLKRGRARKNLFTITILILPLLFFGITELRNSPQRLKNLVFYNNSGFTLRINELRGEHDAQMLHNKFTQSVVLLSSEYLKYFSPQFLVIGETSNPRFGYPGISPVTAVEYVFIFVGLYYLFKNQEKYRHLLVLLFLLSPIPASLAWQEYSVNRSFFILVPGLMLAAYGFIEALKENKGINRNVVLIGTTGLFVFFNFLSWDFYFNHYPKRAQVIRAWECGNREMALFIKKNYNRFNKFYITRKNGQPYISLLFYLQYPPEKYQKEATLSSPDEYGFGQIEKFDKFEFNFKYDPNLRNSVFIGYPDDFNNTGVDMRKIKKIKIGTEEIFWIYESY